MSRPQPALKLVTNSGDISQNQLRDFWKLQNAYIDARDRYFAVQARMILRLNAGMPQEPGKFRLVRKTKMVRRVSWKEEFIKVRGEKAAITVLSHAKAKRYFKLSFEDVVNE